MKLEQWIETTSDWNENLCVMDDPKGWKYDFRDKIIKRLDAVLHQTYPKSNSWVLSNPEYRLEWGNWYKKELFWGDLTDCEIHFLDLLFDVLPHRKELESAKRDRWEEFPVDKRRQLIDAIIDLKEIEKWRLDEESIEEIQMRILRPRFYRILRYISELLDMNWPVLYEADFSDSDLLKVEEKLVMIKKILSSYEPVDTDIITSEKQIYAFIEEALKERGLIGQDSSAQ